MIPRQVELSYQDSMVQSIESRFESDGVTILKDSDPRVQYIERILRPLIQSCVYFSPECEEYLNHLKIIVVEDDTVNTYTTMGGEREDE